MPLRGEPLFTRKEGGGVKALLAKTKGSRIECVGQAIYERLRPNPKDGTNLFKFVYGCQYNDKLALRYKHAPIDACPLLRHSNLCTHNARECPAYSGHIVNRHNVVY